MQMDKECQGNSNDDGSECRFSWHAIDLLIKNIEVNKVQFI